MNSISNSLSVHPLFETAFTGESKRKALDLIKKVNELHLHCEDTEVWEKVHLYITLRLGLKELNSQIERSSPQVKPAANPTPPPPFQQGANPPQANVPQQPLPDTPAPNDSHEDLFKSHFTQAAYYEMVSNVKSTLQKTFHDPAYTNPIIDALQQHILMPLHDHMKLAALLCGWIQLNALYLPLGTHLLEAFKEDMAGRSSFARHVMLYAGVKPLFEALTDKAILQMSAFLADAAQAHSRSYGTLGPRSERPNALVLSVKNGAGGHTVPAEAMAERLKERGWKVVTLNYDEDLSLENDPFELLGITFEDGTPMTSTLFTTRWKMQKHNQEVRRIVQSYILGRMTLAPNLFADNAGGDLLRNIVLPLNPRLIVTTLAYHWTWQSLAYRVTEAKTLLVASDIFFHANAALTWHRQLSLDQRLRQLHFTAMTDDLDLLKGVAVHHDNYFAKKNPSRTGQFRSPLYTEFRLDSQISVIGAPIHPAFEKIAKTLNIEDLRRKYGVAEGAVSICLSRGKLGYDTDLIPALEGYRTTEILPKPLVIHVVCGENTPFYNKLKGGGYSGLGPNITVKPYPLLSPQEFAELRAISLDDIKAGGGSTIEGWYLISKGIPSTLLLTPGRDLWWERSNCDAMEKWGVGRTISDDVNKIEIIKEIMLNGCPRVSYPFPDWKPPFDKVVDLLNGMHAKSEK